MKIKTVDAILCDKCGKMHKINEDTYISIYGNICIGKDGGIIGNNLDKDGKVYRVSIFCFDCFEEILAEAGIITNIKNYR